MEYRADYDYSKIDALHNAVNELLRNSHPEWFADGMVDCADTVRDRVEHLAVDGSRPVYAYNVYHGLRAGESIQLVPEFLHDRYLCTHRGGRGLARRVMEI